MNREELGDLKLNPVEEAALVAFLRTLSDGYQPPRSNRASTPVQPALTGPAGRWPPLYTRVPAHAASP